MITKLKKRSTLVAFPPVMDGVGWQWEHAVSQRQHCCVCHALLSMPVLSVSPDCSWFSACRDLHRGVRLTKAGRGGTD